MTEFDWDKWDQNEEVEVQGPTFTAEEKAAQEARRLASIARQQQELAEAWNPATCEYEF